jgi:[acyl-carrier-protein] S-malonyltransferase
MEAKSKVAFCFPGQIQERPILSKGHPLSEDPLFRAWVDRAERETGMELWKFMNEETEEDQVPLKLQLTTYLFSVIYFQRLLEKGWTPEILTEHSMGIYAALTASEAITFEEGLFITQSIGRLLEEEGALYPGMMASIIGLPLEEIQKIISTLDGYRLAIANYNGSMHYVISGEGEGVQKAMELAMTRKALSVSKLSFNTALHSPSLSHLRGKIRDLLREIEVRPFRYPILNHWTIQPLNRGEVKDFLSEEIARPVYWVRCVEKCIQEGFRQFVEVGKESTLTKLIRWIDREVDALSAEELLFSGG